MKEIIKMIHDGDIYPDEDIVLQDADYKALLKRIDDEKDFLKYDMSAENIERFEGLEGLMSDANTAYTYEHFKYGLKLGVRLMCEVFLGNDTEE